MTTLDTLVEISALYSHNKYGFQATDQVRFVMLTLLKPVKFKYITVIIHVWSTLYRRSDIINEFVGIV